MKKLILHLGAHRCGSTAIQNLLGGKRAELERLGVGLILRRDMKDGRFDIRRLHRFNSFNPFWHWRLKGLAEQIIRLPHQTILVSEENLIGTMPGVLDAGFYPYFGSMIKGLSALQRLLSRHCSIHPRIVVRRQDRFIESVYAFRVSRGLDVSFDAFLKQIQADQLSWAAMLNDIERVIPGVDSKFAVLEAWPRHEGAQKVLEFLSLPDVLGEKPQRLIGNARFDAERLRVLLAANQAGFNAHKGFGVNQLLSLSVEEITHQIETVLSSNQLAVFRARLREQASLLFSDTARKIFLDQYHAENQKFLCHAQVDVDADVWS